MKCALALACWILASTVSLAQDSPPDVDALRKEVAAARARLDAEASRLDALERQLANLGQVPGTGPGDSPGDSPWDSPGDSPGDSPPAAPAPGGVKLRLLDLSLGGLFAAGGSTANADDLRALQHGGHDPHQRGFTVQNVELSMLGAVDPYLQGEAHVILQIDEEGETGVELEEAFVRTTSLPKGLELKAGQFFTDFGRSNGQHPHAWAFANAPVINTRLLGADGLRGPGARLSWLTPAPWYSEVFVGVLNPNGETQASFLGNDELEPIGGHPGGHGKVASPNDMAWSLRWLNSLTLSDRTTLNLGASHVAGPNSTGADTRTSITGLDAFLKWTPAATERGFPFVAWQAEWMTRRYEAGEFTDASGTLVPRETLSDSGFTTQLTYGFRPGWTIGMRLDHADGGQSLALDSRLDPLRDRRDRVSAALTWLPTEFSKLRFQYDLDRAQFLGDALGDLGQEHSLWVQWEFTLGAHGAHAF